jgi:hypothetical protein
VHILFFCRYGFIETNATDGKSMCDLHWKIHICNKKVIIQPSQNKAPNIESRSHSSLNGVVNSNSSQSHSNYNGSERSSYHESSVGQLNPILQSNGIQKDYRAGACWNNLGVNSFNATSVSIPSDLPPLEPIGSGGDPVTRSPEGLPTSLAVEKRFGGI